MSKRDYYDILGVTKNSTLDEIKRAYKKLAREHHPDVAKDKLSAEKKFKEINEAYQVLGDTEKRKLYDQYGHAGVNQGQNAGANSSWGPFSYTYNSSGQNDFGGFDFGNMSDPFDIFEQVFGFRGFGGRRPRKGKNLRYSLKITFAESIKGAEKQLNLNGKKLKVKIPAGVGDGTEIRFTGEGEKYEGTGPAGDLFLVINVEKHPKLVRENYNVYSVEDISYKQAVLGDTLEIDSIDVSSSTGLKKVKLKIPAGTQPGTTFRLKGKGFRHLNSFGSGDQYVQIKVAVPTSVSKKQKDLLRQF